VNGLAMLFAVTALSQAPPPALITGTLERVVAENTLARIELRPSTDRDLPGVTTADRVFRVNTPMFRPPGAPNGLPIAFVETETGAFLFVDTNLDGRLTEPERRPYQAGTEDRSGGDVSFSLMPAAPGVPPLPFRCRVVTQGQGADARHAVVFTAAFRAEGYIEIGGQRTLVSLPYNIRTGMVDVRRGRLAIDMNGDGRLDPHLLWDREMTWLDGERVIIRVRDRYVSLESGDFATKSFAFREHAASEYRLIEFHQGAVLPDFDFVDFDGRARKLSDFKGKHVLLDFWGSWCSPCLAQVSQLKAVHDRFRDRGFEILGIDYEYSAGTEAVRPLLKEKDITWPNATPESVKDLVKNRFRISGFPTLILVGPDGAVVDPHVSLAALPGTLERLLDKR
jgi:thiol-disulfide isomerase/thioredoxin